MILSLLKNFIFYFSLALNKIKNIMRSIVFKYIIGYLFIISIILAITLYVRETRLDKYKDNEAQIVDMAYGTIINSFRTYSKILYINRLNRPEIINIFKNAYKLKEEEKNIIREKLYNKLIFMYNNMKLFHLRQLHFHLPNNDSFLRFHRPNKYGDNLSKIRATVSYVNKNYTPIDSFEEGRLYTGYRFVYPLFNAMEYVGSVETSVSMDAILEDMKDKLQTSLVEFIIKEELVKKKVFSQKLIHYKSLNTLSGYMSQKGMSQQTSLINETIKEINNPSKFLSKNIKTTIKKYNNKYYVLTFLPIFNNMTNRVAGYIISQKEDKDIALVYLQFQLIMLLIMLLFVIIAYAFFKLEVHTKQLTHYKELHDRVESIGSLGSWELDVEKDKLIWSDEVYRIFGVKPQSFEATYEAFLRYIHPLDREKVDYAYKNSIEEKKPYNITHRVLRQDGEIRYVEEDCIHTIDKSGKVVFSTGTVLDITPKKLFEIELKKEKESKEELLKNLPDIIYRAQCNKDRNIIYINKAVESILGYSPKKFLYKHHILFQSIIHNQDLENYETKIKEALRDKSSIEIIYRALHKNGSYRWIKEKIQFSSDTSLCFMDSIIQDITLEKETQDRLQKLIDLQDTLIIITNGSKIEYTNKSFNQFFNIQNVKAFLAKNPCICENFIEEDNYFHTKELENGVSWINYIQNSEDKKRVVKMKHHNGNNYSFKISISDFDSISKIVVFSDISANIEEREQFRLLAEKDKLTGAFNREYFYANFMRYYDNATSQKLKLAFILFDIDHFKRVNDTFGHNIGDDVLISLTKYIKEELKEKNCLIRWGGEEFLILVAVENINEAKSIAQRLRLKIEKSNFKEVNKITCSFGISIYNEATSVEADIKIADDALYKAKKSGRNCVFIAN